MFSSGINRYVSSKPLFTPPNVVPQYCPILKNTGPEYIRQYLNCLVYAWTIYRNSFWMFPVDFMEDVIFCYAWNGSDWNYIQFKINLMDSLY